MTRKTSLLVLLAALAFALSPLLSSGFNGFAPDQFPIPQDNPPVQPAGYAFAIWGLIYLWLRQRELRRRGREGANLEL